MNNNKSLTEWPVHRLNFIVTGEAEERHLVKLLRSLKADCDRSGHGSLVAKVVQRIDQYRPPRTKVPPPKIVGQSKPQPTKLFERIARTLQQWTSSAHAHVIIVDDLEWDWRNRAEQVFDHYRKVVDEVLHPPRRARAAVHFFVMMLEAYYFADPEAVRRAIGVNIKSEDSDVESIRNPKGSLKSIFPGFHEVQDGGRIIRELNLPAILSNPQTCQSLRTLVKWCAVAVGLPIDERYRLKDGELFAVTRGQIDAIKGAVQNRCSDTDDPCERG